MDKKLKENIRKAYEYILEESKKIITKGGSVEASGYAVVMKGDKEYKVIPIPFKDVRTADSRRNIMSYVGGMLGKGGHKVIMFFDVAESWMTKVDKKEYEEKGFIPPSKDLARRMEMLVSSAKDLDNQVSVNLLEIKRAPDGVTFVQTAEVKSMFGIREDVSWFDLAKTVDKKGEDIFSDSLIDSAWEAYKENSKTQ